MLVVHEVVNIDGQVPNDQVIIDFSMSIHISVDAEIF